MIKNKESLLRAIETEINKHSAENGSDTPDYVLAGFLMDCLEAFDAAVYAREKYYNRMTTQVSILKGK